MEAERERAEEQRKQGELVKARAEFDKAGAKYISEKIRMERELAAAVQQGVAAAPTPSNPPTVATAAPQSSPAEARLLEVYKLIGEGQTKQALSKAQSLVQDIPNFQLAQLVYGDLLMSQTSAIKAMGRPNA